ncbi:MAG: hypothetical protein ACLGHO_08270 [Gammaproteobacteria bacterium]
MSAATMYGVTIYQQGRRAPRWVKRAGAMSFWFFLAKGLAWVIVPGAIAWFG